MANRFKTRIEDLKTSFERLSVREKRMVGSVGVAFALAVTFAGGYLIQSSLADLKEHNAAIRKALRDLDANKDTYLVQQRRINALERRMARTPLELNSFVEEAAKKVGVSISESAEISPVEGKRYQQRGLEIKLRKVTVDQLARLMKELESGSAHIVQVSNLSVNTRWNQQEDLDVEMVITTYDRKQRKPDKKGASQDRRERT